MRPPPLPQTQPIPLHVIASPKGAAISSLLGLLRRFAPRNDRLFYAFVLLMGSLPSWGMNSPSALAMPAGYCIECHSPKFFHQVDHSPITGERSVYQAKLDPCPGIRSRSEETFFTESRIIKLNQILQAMEEQGWATEVLRKRVSQNAESFSNLKAANKTSLNQFIQEASAIRVSLQKVYDRTLQARDESARRWLIGGGSLIFLGLLMLLGVAYRKLNRMGKMLLFSCFLGGGLFLDACSSTPVEPVKKSPAQERLEQSLHVAAQSSSKMEESFYQSFLLAEMAREWSKIEAGPAEKAFQLAWRMALAAREKANGLKDLKEVVSGWPDQNAARKEKINFDSVLDLGNEIRNAEGRTWGLRAVAEEWGQANEKKGRQALEFASQEAVKIKDPELRDRELKSIAEAWAAVDEIRALEISRSMADPSLKAMALIDVALLIGNQGKKPAILAEAWKAAGAIPPSYSQAKSLIRVGAATARILPQERKAWGERVYSQLQNLRQPALKTLAIQEMISRWAPLDPEQAERWAMEIPPAFPEARAYSFIDLARNTEEGARAMALLRKALRETAKIADPLQAQKIEGLAVKALANVEPREALRLLPEIEDPFYQSAILELLAYQAAREDRRKALDLAEKIPLEDFRAKTIVAIVNQWIPMDYKRIDSLYREALQAASSIADPYTRALNLIELGKNWGRLPQERGAAAFDLAWKAAGQISRPPKKAEILETLAEAWKNTDKAKARKILEEIDPAVFQVRKSLEEILLWARTDPGKALRWAEAIPSAFPLEKAIALKEVAANMKKNQPTQAFAILEKGWTQVRMIPDGPKRNKLLSQLAVEASLLDKAKAFSKILQIPEADPRDLLLKEVGIAWAREDFAWALKAAREISESSLRQALYQKIAEEKARRIPPAKSGGLEEPAMVALFLWGSGREKAKKEETEATAFYEKALQEIGKVTDPRERSYLFGGLAVSWALIDEEKALALAQGISSEYPEPFSYALLQVGAQLQKWNRRGAGTVFERAFAASANIADHFLRAKRLLQLGQQWQVLDRAKGKEILKKAENEVRKNISSSGKGEELLAEILLAQAKLEPGEILSLARNAREGSGRVKFLVESARNLSKGSLEENLKALDKALQFAQKVKNPRLMSQIAVAWSQADPAKGLEVLARVEAQEVRIEALRQMARQISPRQKEQARRLLDRATQEALAMDGLGEKMKSLKEIAGDWVGLDRDRARATYLQAYQIVEKAEIPSPKF